MTYTMKPLKTSVLLLAIIGLLASCSKDETDGNGLLRISAKASVSENATALTAKSVNTDVMVTDFRMNLKEFELEMEDHCRNTQRSFRRTGVQI